MVQLVKVVVKKPDRPSSAPEIHRAEGENQTLRFVVTPRPEVCGAGVHTLLTK